MSLIDPLSRAIFDGNCIAIDALLVGRNVNMRDDGGCTLLHIALMGLTNAPDPRVIGHLIRLGVHVNAKDSYRWTPLHYAARTKAADADPSLSTACVKLLVEAGADVNAEDNEGVTPLHRSILAYPWNVDLVETLLAGGAKKTPIFSSLLKAVASPDKDRVLELLARYDPCHP